MTKCFIILLQLRWKVDTDFSARQISTSKCRGHFQAYQCHLLHLFTNEHTEKSCGRTERGWKIAPTHHVSSDYLLSCVSNFEIQNRHIQLANHPVIPWVSAIESTRYLVNDHHQVHQVLTGSTFGTRAIMCIARYVPASWNKLFASASPSSATGLWYINTW